MTSRATALFLGVLATSGCSDASEDPGWFCAQLLDPEGGSVARIESSLGSCATPSGDAGGPAQTPRVGEAEVTLVRGVEYQLRIAGGANGRARVAVTHVGPLELTGVPDWLDAAGRAELRLEPTDVGSGTADVSIGTSTVRLRVTSAPATLVLSTPLEAGRPSIQGLRGVNRLTFCSSADPGTTADLTLSPGDDGPRTLTLGAPPELCTAGETTVPDRSGATVEWVTSDPNGEWTAILHGRTYSGDLASVVAVDDIVVDGADEAIESVDDEGRRTVSARVTLSVPVGAAMTSTPLADTPVSAESLGVGTVTAGSAATTADGSVRVTVSGLTEDQPAALMLLVDGLRTMLLELTVPAS